jgi:predicted component of type VI protein secretion system
MEVMLFENRAQKLLWRVFSAAQTQARITCHFEQGEKSCFDPGYHSICGLSCQTA